MDDLTTKVVVPTGAGILGIITSWFGLRWRVKSTERKVCRMQEHVVFKDTCKSVRNSTDERLKRIEDLGKESRNDIKTLLRTMPRNPD